MHTYQISIVKNVKQLYFGHFGNLVHRFSFILVSQNAAHFYRRAFRAAWQPAAITNAN